MIRSLIRHGSTTLSCEYMDVSTLHYNHADAFLAMLLVSAQTLTFPSTTRRTMRPSSVTSDLAQILRRMRQHTRVGINSSQEKANKTWLLAKSALDSVSSTPTRRPTAQKTSTFSSSSVKALLVRFSKSERRTANVSTL